jgi:hypothetical protein
MRVLEYRAELVTSTKDKTLKTYTHRQNACQRAHCLSVSYFKEVVFVGIMPLAC